MKPLLLQSYFQQDQCYVSLKGHGCCCEEGDRPRDGAEGESTPAEMKKQVDQLHQPWNCVHNIHFFAEFLHWFQCVFVFTFALL